MKGLQFIVVVLLTVTMAKGQSPADKIFDKMIGMLDHKVYIYESILSHITNLLNHIRPKTDVRNKVPVHDVAVYPICPTFYGVFNLFTQFSEVCSQYGRGENRELKIHCYRPDYPVEEDD